MNRKDYVANELEELRKVLDLADVAEEVVEQFPDDEDAIRNVRKARATRMIYLHKTFVNIMGVYGEAADYELVDLMERNFESDGESEEVDREVESYFGKLEQQKKKRIIYKRMDCDSDTTA